jgi:hypothetical protein
MVNRSGLIGNLHWVGSWCLCGITRFAVKRVRAKHHKDTERGAYCAYALFSYNVTFNGFILRTFADLAAGLGRQGLYSCVTWRAMRRARTEIVSDGFTPKEEGIIEASAMYRFL